MRLPSDESPYSLRSLKSSVECRQEILRVRFALLVVPVSVVIDVDHVLPKEERGVAVAEEAISFAKGLIIHLSPEISAEKGGDEEDQRAPRLMKVGDQPVARREPVTGDD